MLISLADQANDAGVCWPSVGTIAKRTCYNERTCQRAMAELEQLGYLRKEDRPGRSTVFHVCPQRGDTQSPPPIHNHRRTTTPRGDGVPPRGDGVPPRTVTEPSLDLKAAGQGKPSPVSACWQIYSQGIKRAYGADYPPSAQANGQLAHVVKKLGADPAARTVAHYLASQKPFYIARKHALEVLVKDCSTLWLECQQATGGRAEHPCAYCEAPAIGKVNGIDHCRTHQDDAMDQKRVAA